MNQENRTVKVRATKHPVPMEGTRPLVKDGRDIRCIYPDKPVDVAWTAYYWARVEAGELVVETSENTAPRNSGEIDAGE
ncbi:MAG: hypothetical protein AAGC55_30810 [Myxococcota bacterium]